MPFLAIFGHFRSFSNETLYYYTVKMQKTGLKNYLDIGQTSTETPFLDQKLDLWRGVVSSFPRFFFQAQMTIPPLRLRFSKKISVSKKKRGSEKVLSFCAACRTNVACDKTLKIAIPCNCRTIVTPPPPGYPHFVAAYGTVIGDFLKPCSVSGRGIAFWSHLRIPCHKSRYIYKQRCC